MQFVQVRRDDNSTVTTSFQSLVIKKCQSLFESDVNNQTESAKKLEEINSCANPVIHHTLYIYIPNYRRVRCETIFYGRYIRKAVVGRGGWLGDSVDVFTRSFIWENQYNKIHIILCNVRCIFILNVYDTQEKKKQIQFEYEKYQRKFRHRSVGNCR